MEKPRDPVQKSGSRARFAGRSARYLFSGDRKIGVWHSIRRRARRWMLVVSCRLEVA